MRVLFLMLLGGFSAAAAQAQTHISLGPRLGGNLMSATAAALDLSALAGTDYAYSRSALLGWQVGVGASIGSGHWAVQPALILTQKGMRQRLSGSYSFGGVNAREDDQFDTRAHYLELPINVVYCLGQDGDGFQLFAGPYVAVGVGGRMHYALSLTTDDPSYPGESYQGSQPVNFGDTFVEPDPNANNLGLDSRFRRFDAGINAGVGYRRGPVQVQLSYGLGLLNVQPDYPASYQVNNTQAHLRAVQLAATYYFPLGAK